MLRAAWLAQELLTSFQGEIGEVALIPGTGGIFEVRAGGRTAWSRAGASLALGCLEVARASLAAACFAESCSGGETGAVTVSG